MDEMRRLLTEACLAGKFDVWKFFQDSALSNVYSSTPNPIGTTSVESTVAPSGPNVSLLRHWLDNCVESHLPCQKSGQMWPTRLLHVGSPDSQTLRLVVEEAEKLELAKDRGYAALSYCWGPATREEKEQACLSDKNYDQRLHGFSLNELPKTFRDAVEVTRSLGLSLLWIDALCINQTNLGEPGSDWSKESVRMQDVFSSALLTISATSASHWRQGFCGSISGRSRPQELSEHVESVIRQSNSILQLDHKTAIKNFTPLYGVNDFQQNVNDGPLNQRAWVLQERVLSRRLIHFAGKSTYWECGKHVRCDDFREFRCGSGRHYFLQDPEFPKRLTSSSYYRTIDFLQTLFQQYARSGLSVPSDRNIAISGLIKRMEEVWDAKCRYGIFDIYMHRLLLWRRQYEPGNTLVPAQDSEYQKEVPSWSWMVCSKIKFSSVKRLCLPPNNELHFDTGPGQEESLRVRIRELKECKIRQDGNKLIIVDEGDREVGCCWPDMSVDVTLKHCVVVAMDDSREKRDLADVEKDYCVLFVKPQSGENSFERIGAGRIKAHCVSRHNCESRLV